MSTVLGMEAELRAAAIEHVRGEVGRGSAAFLDVVNSTLEYLEGEAEPDELRALAWSVASEDFAAALAAQASWPARTDNDRLTEAFRALDAAGIVARQDFACCQNCGLTEIGDEARGPARGYAFYHRQDTESAVAGHGVYLAYGRFGQPPTTEIGAEVASALTTAGLTVDWDGTTGQRIRVPLDWAVRRHGRRAAFAPAPEPRPDVDVEVYGGRPGVPEGRHSAEVLALLELPWLPGGVRLRVEPLDGGGGPVVVRRDFDRLVTDDGRVAGRFDGLPLLRRAPVPAPADEPDLLAVRYDDGTYHHDRPVTLAEVVDLVRAMPTSETWLSAQGRSGGVVQLSRPEGRLWVESPHPARRTTTGAYTTPAEAERLLAVLAAEDRAATGGLPGATTTPW
ncbi:DUF6891 domain-containing protein [Cryptosporangium phraense]|uniref:DUF6891 domain-containing protein n=1 Tax=Cryptosporangium phraense TaxID=2593070 RepID=A0A545AX81_9ACTN|nr:hypothetical protein [Cryptosporangium phraense]TQS45918.1 hypothetical protein FL583_05320 [Cryptosporangium phraense]